MFTLKIKSNWALRLVYFLGRSKSFITKRTELEVAIFIMWRNRKDVLPCSCRLLSSWRLSNFVFQFNITKTELETKQPSESAHSGEMQKVGNVLRIWPPQILWISHILHNNDQEANSISGSTYTWLYNKNHMGSFQINSSKSLQNIREIIDYF